MRKLYLNFILEYGVLTVSMFSLVFFILMFLGVQEYFRSKLALVLLVVTTLVSLEFYPYQIISFLLNLIIPIGIIALFIIKKKKKETSKLTGVLIVIFSLYLIWGLMFLSVSANTWGNGPAINGIFIVPNCIVILMVLFSMQQKNYKLFMVSQILIAVLGVVLIYVISDGFSYGEYDGESVKNRRISAVFVCAVCLLNSFLMFVKRNQQKRINE